MNITFDFLPIYEFPKSMKNYFPTLLWISLNWIIVPAPSIPHFAWQICNLKKEFAKKFIIKSQWRCQVTTKYYESDVIYLTDKVHKDSSSFRLDLNAIIKKLHSHTTSFFFCRSWSWCYGSQRPYTFNDGLYVWSVPNSRIPFGQRRATSLNRYERG